MPMARAAWRFDPVAESAAMKARWRSAVQPSERLVLKSRRSPRWEKSPSPEKPVERQRSQMTGMVLIGELEAREILIGKGRMRGSLGAAR
jgi:hypothetical protein